MVNIKSTLLFLTGAGLFVLSACSKSGSSSSTNARLLFANGCVGATATSLTVNGSNVTNATAIAYLGNSGYQTVASGDDAITGVLTGVGPLGAINATLGANASYSVFDCGTVLADTLVVVNDTFPSSTGNYAYARVVNVSSDTTATAITGAVGNTVIGSNIPYAAASAFTQITPGTYTINAFNVNKPANIATLSSLSLSAGKIYTFMYSGNSNSTVGFKLTTINNN